MSSNIQSVYNYTIIPLQNQDKSLMFDIFYFEKGNEKLNCLRITDIYSSFLVHRLPDLTLKQTLIYIQKIAKEITNNDFKYKEVEDLKDLAFCNMKIRNFEYIEIFSKFPYQLKILHEKLYEKLMVYYKHLNYESLSEFDKLFVRNTETPFRYTSYSTQLERSKYWFSAKFEIPFVGYMDIDKSKVYPYQSTYLNPDINKCGNIYMVMANNSEEFDNSNLRKIIKPHDTEIKTDNSEINNLKIASYDIETYNKDMVINNQDPNQYIFCIGLGIFTLMNDKPIKRYSIISKDLESSNDKPGNMIPVTVNQAGLTSLKSVAYKPFKLYQCANEYSENNEEIDKTIYICVQDEVDLIRIFVELLKLNSPHVISGFNNYSFDDSWIYSRIENKSKFGEDNFNNYLQVFSIYNIDELNENNLQSLVPQYKKFSIKMEGKVQDTDNFTVRSNITQSIDIMKIMKKADPKRFSQKYKLDYMLEVYHIKNPFNNKPLSKSGLTIRDMFDNWDHSTNLYEIAFYCMQDSWICTTMIIARNSLIDKLAIANITYTSFEDSLFLADGHRISCLTNYYGYKNNYAIMDAGYKKRSEKIKNNNEYEIYEDPEYDYGLGMKKFDDHTIIGGAVRVCKSVRHTGIVSSDYNSMYPSQYRSQNFSTSCEVDEEIIKHPEKFGLEIKLKKEANDMFGPVGIYYMKYPKNNSEDQK